MLDTSHSAKIKKHFIYLHDKNKGEGKIITIPQRKKGEEKAEVGMED